MSLITHKAANSMSTIEEPGPITGILMINSYEKRMCYAGEFFAQPIEQALNIHIAPSEPVVEIIAMSKKTEINTLDYAARWTGNKHFQSFGNLPHLLPLSIIDKKEGEVIKIIVWGKAVELMCQQKSFQKQDTFENALDNLKELFMHQPSFHMQDKKLLIDARIIVKDNNIYSNGPNGYKITNRETNT
jgi:hypothetical protein